MSFREMKTRLAIEYRRSVTRSSRILKVHGGFSHQWSEANGKVDGIVRAANILGISLHELEMELRQLEREGR